MNIAEQLYHTIRNHIIDELEYMTEEDKNQILENLEKDTGEHGLSFDMVEIMENPYKWN